MTATASNKTDFETLCPASEPLERAAPPQIVQSGLAAVTCALRAS
jgi:hypothetical protein